MVVNFIGSFTTGYVGETSDESHLAYEIEALGHVVRRLPREQWRDYVTNGSNYPEITNGLEADFNLIAKWEGFSDGSFASVLREKSEAPVFYWVWDYMQNEPWHLEIVKAVDLYLGNDVFSGNYKGMSNCYYFPFDVSSKEFDFIKDIEFTRDVAFFGSWIPQGDRQEWLRIINKVYPVTVFSWNYKDWPSEFTNKYPAVYGKDFALEVAKTKISLGFSVDPSTWGYWSNRIGKTLTVGGFLLQQYAPGMELFFGRGIEYFSSPEEAIEKIKYYLNHYGERMYVSTLGYNLARKKLTSEARVKELLILAERFIKKGNSVWKL